MTAANPESILAGLPKGFTVSTDDDVEEQLIVENESKCSDCKVLLQRQNHNSNVCPECGRLYDSIVESEGFSTEVSNGYNVSNNAHVAFKVVGYGPSVYAQNLVLFKNGSDYSVIRRKKIADRIAAWLYQAGSDMHLPQNVQQAAADMYEELQEKGGVVKRSGVLDGLLAACLYYKCIEANIPKKPKIIAQIAQIRDNQLSEGDKMLCEYAQQGIITIPNSYGNSDEYVDQYFERLGIEEYNTYQPFVNELIEYSGVKYIKCKGNSTRPTTRCAGAIYILCKQLKLNISKDTIADKCKISKPTFIRFINMITTHKDNEHIVAVFKKYDIPQLI